MDTRTKIIESSELEPRLGGRPARRVSGHFDPLLAGHVRRIAQASESGRALVVEVTNPPRPLLPQRARAELVAALSMVDFVVLSESGQAMDADLTERFVEHVLDRHRQEPAR
ncbi:MAG TPA: hypothetical protein VFW44_06760 [Bryobacteraceae bacterium]|nr:hypothetical protein [Bryobacteraceae bacterium]